MSKVFLITGAGSGLGRTLAIHFAEQGHEIVLLGRTPAKIGAVAAKIGGKALAITCDVASPDAVRGAFDTLTKRHGKLDVLINNAGVFFPSSLRDAGDALILETISTNLIGAILCSRAAIPLLNPNGHIINISSESVECPYAHLAVYQASKAGLERFTISLDAELEKEGIRVSYVRAGQMLGEGSQGIQDPAVRSAFKQACLERGLDLARRPCSDFKSAAKVIQGLIELPPDLHTVAVSLHARAVHGQATHDGAK